MSRERTKTKPSNVEQDFDYISVGYRMKEV